MPLIIKKNEKLVYERLVETGAVEIDEQGRCWRVAVHSPAGDGRLIPCERRRAEKAHSRGYFAIVARIRGKQTSALVHRLVWLHLCGPIPDGLTVNHRNFNKIDNRHGNLELLSHRDNLRHARRSGVVGNSGPGELNQSAKLTAPEVLDIRRRYEAGNVSLRQLGSEFGVTHGLVSMIVNRRRWAHI